MFPKKSSRSKISCCSFHFSFGHNVDTTTKLYNLLRHKFNKFNKKQYSHTFGALNPVQVVQMNKYLGTVYISGWQSFSTASTTNEPGPDYVDYPANTVPNKVDQLFRAQQLHNRRQNEERNRMSDKEREAAKKVDYFRPIIADRDTGFGGVTSIMKLVKMMVENGAAGIHIEGQRGGAKKCVCFPLIAISHLFLGPHRRKGSRFCQRAL